MRAGGCGGDDITRWLTLAYVDGPNKETSSTNHNAGAGRRFDVAGGESFERLSFETDENDPGGRLDGRGGGGGDGRAEGLSHGPGAPIDVGDVADASGQLDGRWCYGHARGPVHNVATACGGYLAIGGPKPSTPATANWLGRSEPSYTGTCGHYPHNTVAHTYCTPFYANHVLASRQQSATPFDSPHCGRVQSLAFGRAFQNSGGGGGMSAFGWRGDGRSLSTGYRARPLMGLGGYQYYGCRPDPGPSWPTF